MFAVLLLNVHLFWIWRYYQFQLYRSRHNQRPRSFSYLVPFLRAVNGASRGALAKSISNWHLIGYNEGYCSNTEYILLPCFYGIRLWIWPEPLVAPRVRRALGTRMRPRWKHARITSFLSYPCLHRQLHLVFIYL
jgi:hypothetical protein